MADSESWDAYRTMARDIGPELEAEWGAEGKPWLLGDDEVEAVLLGLAAGIDPDDIEAEHVAAALSWANHARFMATILDGLKAGKYQLGIDDEGEVTFSNRGG